VFCGTTNADAYLGDETGNRRFWPVKVGAIDVEGLKRDRDQLWAEAVAAFRAEEKWWLDRDVERAAAEEQAERRTEDVWEAKIVEWAERQVSPFVLSDALQDAVGVPLDRQDRSAQMRGAAALKANGWQRVQRDRKWVYLRPETVYFGHEVGAEAGVGAGVGVEKTEEPQGFHQPHQPYQALEINGSSVASDVRTAEKVGWCGEVGAAEVPPPRPDWRDSGAWLALFREAGTSRNRRLTLALAWGEAAGCQVDTSGGKLDLLMPQDLPDVPAKFALLKQARDASIIVRTFDRGARH
jgi:Virulence-associated protein E